VFLFGGIQFGTDRSWLLWMQNTWQLNEKKITFSQHTREGILCWFWQLKCGGVGGLKLEEFYHISRAHKTWPHFSLGLRFRFCFCVNICVYLDFVPGNWLWPPEGYPLRIKVEIYTYKCHTSQGLCITKQKKGAEKQNKFLHTSPLTLPGICVISTPPAFPNTNC